MTKAKQMKEKTYLIDENNFHQLLEELTHASKVSNAYNKECFGMSDLRLAMRMDNLLGTFIQRVQDVGYCAFALMNTPMKKYGMWIREEAKNISLKQILDNELLIDMSDYAHDMDYAKHLFHYYHTRGF